MVILDDKKHKKVIFTVEVRIWAESDENLSVCEPVGTLFK